MNNKPPPTFSSVAGGSIGPSAKAWHRTITLDLTDPSEITAWADYLIDLDTKRKPTPIHGFDGPEAA